MDFELTSDQQLLRDTVREFARAEIAPVAEQLDRDHQFPYEIVGKLSALDLMGIPFPQEYGGAGGSTADYALVVEELTRVDSSDASSRCTCSAARSRRRGTCRGSAAVRSWEPSA